MENQEEKKRADPLDLLSILGSGTFTATVNGLPFLKVDADSRSIDVEIRGVNECGIRLGDIIELEAGQKGAVGLIKGSEATAKGLSEKGWRLVLYDKSNKILSIGRGVSKLTGHVQVNPLKLRKILESL